MWEELTVIFSHTFDFTNENPFIHRELQDIRDKVLEKIMVELLTRSHRELILQTMLECYNVLWEPKNEDDPRAVEIPDSEGSRDTEALKISCNEFKQLLEIRKVNIGIEVDPKFDIIGYYLDELTMGKVTNLLHEFHDLFLTIFSEMKAFQETWEKLRFLWSWMQNQ